MKRIIALIMVLVLALCMSACTSGANTSNEEAFSISNTSFEKVTEAYGMVNIFSQDIYEAWRLGVNNSSKGCDFSDFVSEMHIEKQYIEQAVADLSGTDTFDSTQWRLLSYSYGGSYFSAYVDVISKAYGYSGDVDTITNLLVEAKTLMKQLSDAYSDYEHYPALKTYFTNTLAFFDFCKNPEGSFDQVVETFNNYRNTARECFFELNYIFSDDIGGMNDAKDEEEEPTEAV